MQRLFNPSNADPPASAPLRVLVVEDSDDDYQLLLAQLAAAGLRVTSRLVEDAPGMREALAEPWDVVISDHNMPRFSSMAALQLLKEIQGDVPFLIVSAAIGEEVAVEALHAGASDYIMKDNLRRLGPAINRTLLATESKRARRVAELALMESETRFRAITSNLPGMVFQLHFAPQDGAAYFSYVSEGAMALFGAPAHSFLRDPQLFPRRIRREDRERLERMFVDCAATLSELHWEGRLADASQERWISISASPRELAEELVWWEGIAFDVTKEKHAELEIRESREQLRQLSAHVEKVKESERSRIAREIHDDIGGTLTAVKLDLAWLGGRLSENDPLAEKIQTMQEHLDSALLSSIRIARDLRPSLLDYGIVPAIEWQLGDFRDRMGIACELNCPHEDIELNPDLATAVFRIFQEALTNIAKHASATNVKVKFAVTEDAVALQVCDNGVGLDQSALAKPKSFGLRGMRERVAELGGTLDINGSADAGTAQLPLLDLDRLDDLDIRSSTGAGTTLKLELPRQRHRSAT